MLAFCICNPSCLSFGCLHACRWCIWRIHPENPTPTDSNITTFGRFFRKNKLELKCCNISYLYVFIIIIIIIWPLFWAIIWDLLRELEKPVGADWIAMNRWRKLQRNSEDALSCGQPTSNFQRRNMAHAAKSSQMIKVTAVSLCTNVRIALDIFVHCSRLFTFL